MARYRAFALFGGLVCVVALVCATIVGGVGLLGGGSGPGSASSFWNSPLWSASPDNDQDGQDSQGGQDGSSGPGGGGPAGAPTGTGDRDPARNPARNPVGAAEPASADAWVGTWAAAPAGVEPRAPIGHPGSTIRNVVHTSIGGTSVRVTLSNLYSPRALLIGHASVAVGDGNGGAQAAPGTMRRLTFGRNQAVTIPAGGQIVSDPVRLRVPYDGDLLVTLHTPAAGGPVTYHPHAAQTSYMAVGDRTEDPAGASYAPSSRVWRYLTAVDVLNRDARGAVVTFGDSITDGVGSTPDTNRRWPDVLADRLRDQHIGVLNEGIGGNQVLGDGTRARAGSSGISRFQRDVLDRSGAKVVVIDLGINDILRGRETDPTRITNGLKNLTRQAHARGLRVVGSTLTPFGAHRGYNEVTESVRERVNEEIRSGRVFDAVVDFDRVIRDPYAPDRVRPLYDAGDGLHPSDAGYRAMGRHLSLQTLTGKIQAQL
ncbi:SGNH/GDSL hydrolase family protein [Streptomyces hebeiensis]|uniref:SGNH/GDSL hydrolase family protein n=1 Tax=Streptomyces hebeiensis TaxID=229486 RepID=A0ABN1UWW7_9ACTN